MQLYLAAAWSRKKEVRAVADELNTIPGLYVHSRWLLDPDEAYGKSRGPVPPEERAAVDVQDVRDADILVRFTDDMTKEFVSTRLITGARMFEMGLAYAIGKKIVVVGGIQPIFDYLPEIVHVPNVDELKQYLISEITNG